MTLELGWSMRLWYIWGVPELDGGECRGPFDTEASVDWERSMVERRRFARAAIRYIRIKVRYRA